MNLKKINSLWLLVVFLGGCAHEFNVKNIDSYYSTSSGFIKKPLTLGLRVNSSDFEGKKISKMTANALNRCNVRVTSAFVEEDVDVVASMSIHSDYKGSGWNFLINFPGFLVWAPAWHGYNYTVSHQIRVVLTESASGKTIDTVQIPVVLNIRHADISRTWTEISWLEFGVVAFVGGIVFINYDDDVTPLVTEKAGPVVAEYIAQEIVSSIQRIQPAVPRAVTPVKIAKPTVVTKVPAPSVLPVTMTPDVVQKKLITLKRLLDQGLLTQDEYDVRVKALNANR